MPTVVSAGRDSGSRIRRKKPSREQPSIAAAASSSPGTARKNGRRMKIVTGSEKAASGSATPIRCSSRPSWRSNRYSGRLATLAGKSSPIMNVPKIASRPRNSYRESANAAIAPRPTASVVATTAMKALLASSCQNMVEVMIEL